jgi:hypothetical protein
MANIWQDTTAPYVLVAALGATGWIVNAAVSDLKQLKLVEYEINSLELNGQAQKIIDVYNRSASYSLLDGDIYFYCGNGLVLECFGNKGANGTPISPSPLSGASLKTEVFEDGNNYRAEARLLAQSATRFTVSVTDKKQNLAVLYVPKEVSEGSAGNIIFREGRSWEGWLIANYLPSLICAFGILSALFLSWCALSLWYLVFGKSGSSSHPKPPEKIYIVLNEKGDAHDSDA